ncbi:unnamed protein product [Caenorhabditis auriculariae]|uniref:Tyrosine-protein phosphatase domain-containing protein n=1 Tax=Caenorhabditis auriculariae TaxID=2777116 RepID=A0A8S1HV80_9PELO|nr:unnamed protein product [Caenorhabditis auriculariae]
MTLAMAVQMTSYNRKSNEDVKGSSTCSSSSSQDDLIAKGFVQAADEFLFDINTGNASKKTIGEFVRSFSKSSVFSEFVTFTDYSILRNRNCWSFYEHPLLNRFYEIPLFEATRIKVPHESGHDYIHASEVDGFRERGKFIITQAPLAASTEQFWLMQWLNKVPIVVSLTEMVDENKLPILPKKRGESMKLGKISIEILHCRHVRNSYDSAVLKIQHDNEPPRKLLLLSFHSWGHKGTPRRPTELLDLVADVNYNRELLRRQAIAGQWLKPDEKFPVTLMCFSGVGRSCVVAGLDVLCRRLEASAALGTPLVDVLDTVKRVRIQRAGAFPKPEQYLYLSMAVLEFGIRTKLIPNNVLNQIDLINYMHQQNEME